MAIAQSEVMPASITFEDYEAEGEINRRYDIIEGRRYYMPGAKWGHQAISKRLTLCLSRFESEHNKGQMAYAPFDILIRRYPLQTRQPDILFISNERLVQQNATTETGYLTFGPELVVEILSQSDTRSVIEDKIADYQRVEVLECWIVNQKEQTIEVLRLTPANVTKEAVYTREETAQSVAFPDLKVSVKDIFAV
jgi:Uma2 family endonuclease